MNSSILFHAIIAFGAFQALFISFILLIKKNKTKPQVFFCSFLIIEGVTLIERLLAETGLINNVPHLLGVSYPISFLKPPLLLFMTFAIVNTNFKFKKIHSLHLIPFIIFLVLNIPFYFLSADQKLSIVADFLNKEITYLSFDFFLYLSFFIHIGAYLIFSILTLKKYKHHFKNNALVNWILKVFFWYSIFLCSHFIYFIVQPSGIVKIPQFNIINMLIMTFVIQSIAYSFINGITVFNQQRSVSLKNLDQFLKDETVILNKFENEKVYLDDQLNLNDFSESVALPKKYVSELVNQKFGSSFKDLIIKYRVQEAQRLMVEKIDSKTSLINIAFDSGFNNKVTFYRAFKNHTGKSPSEYFNWLKKGR